MAITSGLFNSKNGDRVYDAVWFARYFATFIGNGVFPNPSSGLQVMADTNMDIYVRPGDGWINGYFIVNDSNYTLHLDPADGVLKRIDRVVMRLDYDGRVISINVRKGTPASTPVAPSLQRDINYYELALADVTVGNGVTSIIQGDIVDTRLNNTLCGIVHGTVDQVDTTTIFNQYQSWFISKQNESSDIMQTWMDSSSERFNIWFEDMRGILEGDVAANLAGQITKVAGDLNDLSNELDSLSTTVYNAMANINDSYSLTKQRTNKDSNGIFTNVSYKRKRNGKLYATSVLSDGTSPKYTKRTETMYAEDGTTVIGTTVYTITYDSDGDWVGEV